MYAVGRRWSSWVVERVAAGSTSQHDPNQADELWSGVQYALEATELVRFRSLKLRREDAYTRVMAASPSRRQAELESVRLELRELERFTTSRATNAEKAFFSWLQYANHTVAQSIYSRMLAVPESLQVSTLIITGKLLANSRQFADKAYRFMFLRNQSMNMAQLAYNRVMAKSPMERENEYKNIVKSPMELENEYRKIVDKSRRKKLPLDDKKAKKNPKQIAADKAYQKVLREGQSKEFAQLAYNRAIALWSDQKNAKASPTLYADKAYHFMLDQGQPREIAQLAYNRVMARDPRQLNRKIELKKIIDEFHFGLQRTLH